MRNFTLSALIVLTMLSACKKDNLVKAEYSVYAQKNNVAWIASNPYTGFVNVAQKDSVLIIAQNGEETLGIKFKSKGVGTYLPQEVNAYFFTTVGLDVIVSAYKLSSDESNILTITNYDEGKNAMTGNFNLTFQKTYGDSKYFPDKIVFTKGALRAQIHYVNLKPFNK